MKHFIPTVQINDLSIKKLTIFISISNDKSYTQGWKIGKISNYGSLHAIKFYFFPDYGRLQTTNVGYNVD